MNERPCIEACDGASHYHLGIAGAYSHRARIMLILNKPDSRIKPKALFDNYEAALFETRTGAKIAEMLAYCNLHLDHVFITNLFKCVLPGDREPRKGEYRRCASLLEKQIMDFNPRRIISFGNRVFETVLQNSEYKKFSDALGKVVQYKDKFPTLILNHPSKKWMYSRERREDDFDIAKKFLHHGTITLCGSSKFFENLWPIKYELETYGYEVLMPSMVDFHHLLTADKERFLKRQRASTIDHYEKIARSDAIYVANYDNEGIPGRIGENSFSEICVAFYRGIPIYLMNPVPNMAYGDLVESMQPTVVGEDWKLMDEGLAKMLVYVSKISSLEEKQNPSQDI